MMTVATPYSLFALRANFVCHDSRQRVADGAQHGSYNVDNWRANASFLVGYRHHPAYVRWQAAASARSPQHLHKV